MKTKEKKVVLIETVANFGEFQEKAHPDYTPHYEIMIRSSAFAMKQQMEQGHREGRVHAYVTTIAKREHLLQAHIVGEEFIENAIYTETRERDGFWSFLGPKEVKVSHTKRTMGEAIKHLKEFVLKHLPEATPGKWELVEVEVEDE